MSIMNSELVCENSVASEDYSQYEDTYVMYEEMTEAV